MYSFKVSMRHPIYNKKIVFTLTEEEKRRIIEAGKKSYRTISSIAREGTMLITNKIVTKK